MAGKIFINYRRGDDPGNTGRLFDRLQDAFSREQLFIDIDNIGPGLDFTQVLNERVAECDVVLAVIGKNWIDVRDSTGVRRLDDPDDFVRIELASALGQGKRVIPVLVGEAQMPRPDELPEAIRSLARRNAVRLTHERFHADMQGLIKALHATLNEFDARRIVERNAARRRDLWQPDAAATWKRGFVMVAAGLVAVVLVAAVLLISAKTATVPPNPVHSAAATPAAPASANVSPQMPKTALPPQPTAAQPGPTAKSELIQRPLTAPQPPQAARPAPSAQSESRTPVAPTPTPDAVAWSLLNGSNDDNSFKRFVAQYPNSPFRKDAETQIAALAEGEAARIAAKNRIEMMRSLQVELKRVGCYQGAVNGRFDDATKMAWQSFGKLAEVSPPDEPTSDAIKTLRAIDKRVCPLVCPTGQHATEDLCVADVAPLKPATADVAPSRPIRTSKPRPVGPKAHARCFSYGGSQYCQ